MADLTPMMQQYRQIKAETPDCILFFRLGDFYEMFNEDALLVSKELDLTLTTRDRGKDPEDQTPMCGVPYHSCEAYIARLLAKGYKVAICEQTEDPALAKGLVSREVVRIITPGTVVDGSMLEQTRQNYLCAVCFCQGGYAVCFAELSTGELLLASFDGEEAQAHILNELVRYTPAEAILNAEAARSEEITQFLTKRIRCLSQTAEEFFDPSACAALFEQHFGRAELERHEGETAALCAAGALLRYLHDTQKMDLAHLNEISFYTSGEYMELDYQTRRNLELTETLRGRDKRGSLLWVLDRTKTAMGGRLLRSWLEKPLLSSAAIRRRLNAVGELVENTVARGELIEALRGVDDLERLIGRIGYGNGNCRDLAAIASTCDRLPALKELLAPLHAGLLTELAGMDALEDVGSLVHAAVCDEPPFSVREGGMLREGFNEEVDRLRALSGNAQAAVLDIEARERARTGLKKLRVSYNKVFGYYIELPRSVSEQVPADYMRKQTLVNTERFITGELKDLENELLTARERLQTLEYELFCQVRDAVAARSEGIRRTAQELATLDVLCSLAEVAARNGYCMPEVNLSDVIDIRDGRHPVVERARTDALFVPNDTLLNCEDSRVAIITGPNMAGKSTYMRQTALIVLMAQIGSFVPARQAHIGITGRIFTRIGASDDLSSGQSTFMVEMNEVAQILHSADRTSLLILDEIGRGTSTYDGMAIARAVLEYCADRRRLGARTMFATHYHELTELQNTVEGVHNFNIAVKKRGEDIIFLRKIVPGGADRSYGIEVAKLAGVPESIIRRARALLSELEKGGTPRAAAPVPAAAEEDCQFSLADAFTESVRARLQATDLNTLTPLEAMNLLFELKKELNDGII